MMTDYNDTLLIAGTFTNIDGSPIKYIAKWIGGNAVDTCSTPQGVTEIQNEDAIIIYPNPVSESITISINTRQNFSAQIILYNTLGEKIIQQKITSPKTEINLSNLPSGIYFLEVSTTKEIFRRKIIKQ